MNSVESSVTVELWTTKPDVAEDRMNSDSVDASDYTVAGWLVGGGILATLITNLAIKYGSGPFSGIFQLAISAFKKIDDKKDHTTDS